MSEDNTQKTISEETISAIVSVAQNIAQDSDAMRQSVVAIADALQPMIQQAGIRFEASPDCMWHDGDEIEGYRYYYRLAIVKRHKWEMVIEEDCSQCLSASMDEVRSQGGTTFIGFDKAARWLIVEVVGVLATFLNEYATELKHRHQKYADMREKAEQIISIVDA